MGQDVSLEVAGQISGAKVFGASDNIRHGKYRLLIKRIFADLVETDAGKHKMAFWEFKVLASSPNPQSEGDHVDYPGAAGPLRDDGMRPNAIGSDCALKVDFDGPGGRSAGANIKQAVLALFNKNDGEIPDTEVNATWIDLSRRKDVKAGEIIGFDAATNQPIVADKDKRGNPACGMVIDCHTMTKKKRTANEKGAYITKLIFTCAAPIGTGENAPDLVAKRRAEIEATLEDEEESSKGATRTPTPAVTPPAAASVTLQAPTPPAPPAPPVAPSAFVPAAPWVKHPTAAAGPTPETRWFWSDPALGGNNGIKNEAQLRAGQ